jgi:EpsI family protein
MSRSFWRWVPAPLLAVGVAMTFGVDTQQSVPLRLPLASVVPGEIAGYRGRDLPIAESERRVSAVTSYLMRVYTGHVGLAAAPFFSVYIGYYDRQTQGKTIHSPRNCLPGNGWEPLTSRVVVIATPAGSVLVNRYLLQRGKERALVLYWYQGRGRVESNEYLVKRDLLRDAALRNRSEEALVRIVVPVRGDDEGAFRLASQVASTLVPAAGAALPL